MRRRAPGLLLAVATIVPVILIAGCRHESRVYVPPAPILLPEPGSSNTAPPTIARNAPIAPAPSSLGTTSAADLAFVSNHVPVWSETGTAKPPVDQAR